MTKSVLAIAALAIAISTAAFAGPVTDEEKTSAHMTIGNTAGKTDSEVTC